MRSLSSIPVRALAAGFLSLALASCGDGGDGTGPTPSGTFTISAPASVAVEAGSSATVQVAVTRTRLTSAITLTLEGAPEGVTFSFSPATVPGSGTGATLSISAAATAAPGSYSLKVCGSAAGVGEKDATMTLTVTPAPIGGFSLALQPGSLSVEQGQTATVTVTVSRTAPFAGPVALQILMTPPGVSRTFDPAVIPPGEATSTLTIAVAGYVDPGAYTLVVSGSAAGVDSKEAQLALTVTARPGEFMLAVAPAALVIEQGKMDSARITITRIPPWEGRVTLTLDGLPNGVLASLPGSFPGDPTPHFLKLSVVPTVAPGVYPLTIRATGPGAPDKSVPLGLTVVEPPGFTLQAGSVGVPQGRVGGAGIRVFRKGGFTGAVSLVLEGTLPPGVTAALAAPTIPAGQELNSINFSMLATAPVGLYQMTLHGTASGVPNYDLQVTYEVRAAPAGNVTLRVCSASETPVWLGYQNGSEQWTQVAGPGGVFNFPITAATGGIAWVVPWEDGTGFHIGMFLGTQAELLELASLWCQYTPTRKSHTGSVANVGSDWYNVSIGDASVEVHGGTGLTYRLDGVPTGVQDLVASKTTIPVGTTNSTMIIRRGINYPAGDVIPLLDFASGEAFVTTTLNATLQNLGTEAIKFTEAYITAGGTVGLFAHRDPKTATTPFMVVPAAKAQAGDFYTLKVETSTQTDGTVNRTVLSSFDAPTDRTLVLGPALTAPSVFQLQAAPLYQVRVVSTWQPEYGNAFTGHFFQDTRDGEFWVTRGYLGGGGTIDIATPDLRFVPGWTATWGPVPGELTVLGGAAYGWSGTSSTLLPGLMGDFLMTPNMTVRSATLHLLAVP